MPRFPFAALPFLALSSLPAVAQEATPPAPAPDVAPATSNGKSDDISSNELAALIADKFSNGNGDAPPVLLGSYTATP